MSWWPFQGQQQKKEEPKSELDASVPPPPGGSPFMPPPELPAALRSKTGQVPVGEFKGFSAPPPVAGGSSSSSSAAGGEKKEAPAKPGFSVPSFSFGKKDTPSSDFAKEDDKYTKEDYSKYSSKVTHESDGLSDDPYAQGKKSAHNYAYDSPMLSNPRARQCFESIKMGVKMGATVGGCFGVLTGLWAAVSQRNFLIFPISVVGGAVSFGFFLGCGMIVRCEDREGNATYAYRPAHTLHALPPAYTAQTFARLRRETARLE